VVHEVEVLQQQVQQVGGAAACRQHGSSSRNRLRLLEIQSRSSKRYHHAPRLCHSIGCCCDLPRAAGTNMLADTGKLQAASW
jgi:hypothetical protein